eukprot:TRINITY_DN12497_c0_g1_i1.p1 TRINITY_DN12497_c0_g1~~TRINITY_DN12497_c0_g1_i1.p1  ORF type:complete len:259 (+),score=49.48 TRINITY_DN12497_c0_g1_i1:46-777(+)
MTQEPSSSNSSSSPSTWPGSNFVERLTSYSLSAACLNSIRKTYEWTKNLSPLLSKFIVTTEEVILKISPSIINSLSIPLFSQIDNLACSCLDIAEDAVNEAQSIIEVGICTSIKDYSYSVLQIGKAFIEEQIHHHFGPFYSFFAEAGNEHEKTAQNQNEIKKLSFLTRMNLSINGIKEWGQRQFEPNQKNSGTRPLVEARTDLMTWLFGSKTDGGFQDRDLYDISTQNFQNFESFDSVEHFES